MMRVPSLRYCPEKHKRQQHWQGWDQFGMTGVFLSAPRYDWCTPLSHHLPVCLWIMDPHNWAPKKNTSLGNEVLPQDTTHLIQRPCYQRGSPCQDPAGNWTTRRSSDDRKETQTAVVWSCFPFIGSGQNFWCFEPSQLQRITSGLNTNINLSSSYSFHKAVTNLDWQEYFSQLQDTTDALPCHIHLPVCLWIMDPHSRAPKKNTSHGNEVLPQDTTHPIQRSCFQRGSPCQDPAGNWTTRRPSDDRI